MLDTADFGERHLKITFLLMIMKVLYAGDGSSKGAARYLISAMKKVGIDYTHFPPNQLHRIPSSLNQLSKFDAIILSDAPSSLLGKRKMISLKEYVEKGGGLGMIGGWESFTGSHGNYKNTPIEEVLPVCCMPSDDRVNDSNGFKMIKKCEHTILKGLPWSDAPTVCGYNKVVPKDDSEILLTLKGIKSLGRDKVEEIKLAEEEQPLLVVHDYEKGRTLALTTDVAPHWVGGMVDWGSKRIKIDSSELGNNYIQFLYNSLSWLSKRLV